ncbi:hypothetical protein DFH09DRAFT_1079833 [Mycena vulgaris]|nr:hypothetical protein DFH09DRAFT_1079833 [Mycena vulgaris]
MRRASGVVRAQVPIYCRIKPNSIPARRIESKRRADMRPREAGCLRSLEASCHVRASCAQASLAAPYDVRQADARWVVPAARMLRPIMAVPCVESTPEIRRSVLVDFVGTVAGIKFKLMVETSNGPNFAVPDREKPCMSFRCLNISEEWPRSFTYSAVVKDSPSHERGPASFMYRAVVKA